MAKVCIECKERPARYWSSSFCEECFRKILQEKLDEDTRKKKIESERLAAKGWE
jgi:hypothetical protein